MNNNKLILIAALVAAGLAGGLYVARKKQTESVERTLVIIKPEAVAAGKAPDILKLIKDNGFVVVTQKDLTLDKAMAEKFYGVHSERPFFADLVTYMTSGPAIALVLEKPDAVKSWRALMGATNPENAEAGTIRKLFGTDIQRNAVHGSDTPESAKAEIAQLFPEL